MFHLANHIWIISFLLLPLRFMRVFCILPPSLPPSRVLDIWVEGVGEVGLVMVSMSQNQLIPDIHAHHSYHSHCARQGGGIFSLLWWGEVAIQYYPYCNIPCGLSSLQPPLHNTFLKEKGNLCGNYWNIWAPPTIRYRTVSASIWSQLKGILVKHH